MCVTGIYFMQQLEEEIWKDIIGYEGRYSISNFGKVKSLKFFGRENEERVLKPIMSGYGKYHAVALHKDKKQKTTKLHRLVAEHFIPNPENKPTVNHINGRKQDNRIENLEWATWKEQVNHAYENLSRKGKPCEELMQDMAFRENAIDTYLRHGGELVPVSYLRKHINNEDLMRNGIPPELLETGELKQKSLLEKWLLVLVLGCCLDNKKSLSVISGVTGLDVPRISKIRSGQVCSKLLEIYHKYKVEPEYVCRHIAKISLAYNGNYKDM